MYIHTARAEHTAARGDPAGASEGTRTRASPHARARGVGRGGASRTGGAVGGGAKAEESQAHKAGRVAVLLVLLLLACMCAVRPGRGVGVVARVPRAREALVPVKRARCLRRHRQRQTPVNRRMLWRARGGGQAMAREGAADPQENGGPAAPRVVSTPRETCPRSCPHAWHVAGHCVRARIRRPRTLRDFVGTMS